MLNLARLFRWQGWRVWREPLVLVLHTSYAFLPLGLAAIGAATFGLIGVTSALHVLTVGAVANMTLAVMTRVSRGHTGNALAASMWTTTAYIALILSALVRPLVDFFPAAYHLVLNISGSFWLLGFGLFVGEYAPMLLRERKGR